MKIEGKLLDKEGRCEHYHDELDTINIQFNCCRKFYACIHCHNEIEQHETIVWPKTEFEKNVIHCGNCNQCMSINNYLKLQECPNCQKTFNPNCYKHHGFYFETK